MESFWQLADSTRTQTEYLADERLKSLRNLPLPVLAKIFVQYRYFTIYYIDDLSLLVHRLPFGKLRSLLSEFLAEELGCGEAEGAHPQLYDSFLVSIGMDAGTLDDGAIPANIGLLGEISQLVREKSPTLGVGLRGLGGECLCQLYLEAMHVHFSKNPEIVAIADRVDWRFWDIHAGEVDIGHRLRLRAAIDEEIARSPDLEAEIRAGYEKSKHAWDQFWTNIFAAVDAPAGIEAKPGAAVQ
jgi:Iron-containing redox enzyme